MLKTTFGWTILLVGIAMLGIGWITYSQDSNISPDLSEELSEAPIAGYSAPQFTLNSTQGEQVSLSDHLGKPVVLNFWASWCPPCRAEIPHFQNTSVKYNGQAIILGVDQGEPLPIVADFGASLGITYPLLLDEDNSTNRVYNVRALPTTVFIDANGVVSEVFTGVVNGAVLDDRIGQLLAER